MAESHEIIEVEETDEGESADGCRKRNRLRWKSDKDNVVSEFLTESSLHGLKYIGQPKRHIVERVFWIVTFVVGLAAAGYLINGVFSRYEETPVIVSFQSKEQSVNTIPFPAVTFCYNLQFTKEKVESLIRRRGYFGEEHPLFERISEMLEFINGTCQTKKSTFVELFDLLRFYKPQRNTYYYHKNQSKLQEDIIDILLGVTPSCEDMIPYIMLDGENVRDMVFNPVITAFGKCCTFNMLPTPIMLKQPSASNGNEEDMFSNPVLGTRRNMWGEQADIDDWQKWSYEKGFILSPDRYKSQFSRESRWKISHPYRNQRLGKDFGLSVYINTFEPYCDEVRTFHGITFMLHNPVDTPRVRRFPSAIGLEQEAFIKINPDITLADPDIRDLKIEKRQCLFGKEQNLKYFRPYTQENCFQSCIADLIERLCGCSLFYMPRANVKVLFEQHRWLDEKMCVELAMGYLSNKETCGHCLPLCEYIDYNFEMTNAKLNWYHEKNFDMERDPRKNRSVVHIFYASPSTVPKLRKRLYGYTDLIANTGGILGLCLGFSVLSGAEVLYYVLMRTIWQIISRRWVRCSTKEALASGNTATIKLKNPAKSHCPGWDNKSKFKRTKQFYKHCFGKRNALFRFKWLFCILVGSVACGLMVYMLLVRNEENVKTKDTFNAPSETNKNTHQFWAEATFCYVNQFSLEKVLELGRVAESATVENHRYSAERNLSIIDAMCEYKDALETSSSSFPPINPDVANYTYLMKFLEENTISCSQMFPACVYMGMVQKDCSEIIKPVDTVHGRCCRLLLAPAQPKFANSYFDKLTKIEEELNGGLTLHSEDNQYHKIENSSLLRRVEFNSSYFDVYGANLFEEISTYIQPFHFSVLSNLNENSYQCDNTTTSTNKVLFSLHSPGKSPQVEDFFPLNVANEEVVLILFPEAVPSDSSEEMMNDENRNCDPIVFLQKDLKKIFKTTGAAIFDYCTHDFASRNCRCALFGFNLPSHSMEFYHFRTCKTGSNSGDTDCLKKMNDFVRKTPGLCPVITPNSNLCNGTAYNYTTTNQSMRNAAKLWESLRRFGNDISSAIPWANNKTGIIHFVFDKSRQSLKSTNKANSEVYLAMILITVVASLMRLSLMVFPHLWRCICGMVVKRTLYVHGALHLRKT